VFPSAPIAVDGDGDDEDGDGDDEAARVDDDDNADVDGGLLKKVQVAITVEWPTVTVCVRKSVCATHATQ